MAIQWGGYAGSNNERVGIEVWTDGYDTNTPSINVYIDIYVEAMYNTNDSQTLSWGGSGIGGSTTFQMTQGTKHITRQIIYGQGQNYNGGPYYEWSASISGHYGGATPGVTVGFTLPARPPNIPGPPPTAADSVTASSARVVVAPADPRGSGISRYNVRVQRNDNGAIVYDNANTPGTTTVTGLTRATAYVYFARGLNGVGWGEWSTARGFTTLALAPGNPTNVTATNVTADSATLSWAAPADDGGSAITSYQVQTATDAAFTQNAVTTSGAGLSRALTGLPPGTRIYTRVRAVNAINPGAWSAVGQFDTQLPAFVNQSGTWKRAMAWVKWEGAWRQARVWKRTTTGWTL